MVKIAENCAQLSKSGQASCVMDGDKKKMAAVIPLPCPDPFGILSPVARDRASARRCYPLLGFSPNNTSR